MYMQRDRKWAKEVKQETSNEGEKWQADVEKKGTKAWWVYAQRNRKGVKDGEQEEERGVAKESGMINNGTTQVTLKWWRGREDREESEKESEGEEARLVERMKKAETRVRVRVVQRRIKARGRGRTRPQVGVRMQGWAWMQVKKQGRSQA